MIETEVYINVQIDGWPKNSGSIDEMTPTLAVPEIPAIFIRLPLVSIVFVDDKQMLLDADFTLLASGR